MSDPNQYIVGWICAISTEYVAARAILDEKHGAPELVSPNDNNSYTLGRIGKHNVVVTLLPEGEYGTDSAASVAKDLMNSFPNVRIGLMVGIGGGAPLKHDVRLGDIVVSSPRDGTGGVFQYDYGKTIQDRAFKQTRALNQAPTVLRTAMAGLKAQYEEEGHQIEQTVTAILEKNPRLLKKYRRPVQSTDKLFHANYTHASDTGESCEEVCSDDPSNLVSRRDRSDTEDNPAIHYGLIASANQVMKNALIRDKLSREKDVLCFETEAAGLMNHFPCLVIRGICDYADSHKNKKWQGYAAMVAAVYAKDILLQMNPTRVEAEKKLAESISIVKKRVNELHAVLENTNVTVTHFSNEQKRRQIEEWLAAPDHTTNYHTAAKQRHEETGLWFIKSSEFCQWKSGITPLLCLYGVPGCGKTVLSSTIIQDLEKDLSQLSSHAFLYFYFDFRDPQKQTTEGMVCSLISQLSWIREDCWKLLEDRFSSLTDKRRTPTGELLNLLLVTMIQQFENVWVVLDALDECSTKTGKRDKSLLWLISHILRAPDTNVHVLMTTRPEQGIISEIRSWNLDKLMMPIQSDLITDDIRMYVQASIRRGKLLERWGTQPDIQDEIEAKLMEKANGMFRWVACQMEALEECLDLPLLRASLGSLPTTLDETYSRILQSIPDTYKPNAIKILQFLAVSRRPLRVEEAVDAIAVDPGGNPRFDPRNRMPVPEEISLYCSSLVIIVCKQTQENDDECFYTELHLSHLSVKEYLMSKRLPDDDFEQAFNQLEPSLSAAEMCLAYLTNVRLETRKHIKELRKAYPFADHCSRFWTNYAAVEDGEPEALQKLIIEFFHDMESYILCIQLYYLDDPRGSQSFWDPEGYIPSPPKLYYASLNGLAFTCGHLIHAGADVNERSGTYGNALQAASARGHEKVVRVLLQHTADVHARCGHYGSALQAASARGHGTIMQMLLNENADVNAQGGHYGNALQAASAEGHEATVQMLINRGAKINSQGGYHANALQAACTEGHNTIAQILLDNGANINYQGEDHTPALLAACINGHETLVQTLLDNGANIDAQCGKRAKNGTALQAASAKGHEGVVQLLLKKGADINAQVDPHVPALLGACINGQKNVVKTLLDSGADVNAQCGNRGNYGNALMAATCHGHEAIVRLLLWKGADINAEFEGGRFCSALVAASDRGYEGIVQILLENGANVNKSGRLFGTALWIASYRGHEVVVRMLLEKDADININRPGVSCGTPLQAASQNGHESIVQMLLQRGAFVESCNGQDKDATG